MGLSHPGYKTVIAVTDDAAHEGRLELHHGWFEPAVNLGEQVRALGHFSSPWS